MIRRLLITAVCGFAVGLAWLGNSQGQVAAPDGSTDLARPGATAEPGSRTTSQGVESSRWEINELVKNLRDIEDAAKKKELTAKLEDAVAKLFDQDLEAREAELTKLEARLQKLRGLLEKRRQARTDIIQLQLKVLVNEAEGLGFSGGSFLESGTVLEAKLWGNKASGTTLQRLFDTTPTYPATAPNPLEPVKKPR